MELDRAAVKRLKKAMGRDDRGSVKRGGDHVRRAEPLRSESEGGEHQEGEYGGEGVGRSAKRRRIAAGAGAPAASRGGFGVGGNCVRGDESYPPHPWDLPEYDGGRGTVSPEGVDRPSQGGTSKTKIATFKDDSDVIVLD